MIDLGALELTFLEGAVVGAFIHGSLAIWYTRRQRIRFERDVDAKLTTSINTIDASVGTRLELITKDLDQQLEELTKDVEHQLGPITAAVEIVHDTVAGVEAELKDRIGQLSGEFHGKTLELGAQVDRAVDQLRPFVRDTLATEIARATAHFDELFSGMNLDERFSDAEAGILEATKLEVVPMITGSIGGTVGSEIRRARTEMIKDQLPDADKEELAEMVSLLGKKRGSELYAVNRAWQKHQERRRAKRDGAQAAGRPTQPPGNQTRLPGEPRPIPPAVLAQLEAAGFKREVPSDNGGEAPSS